MTVAADPATASVAESPVRLIGLTGGIASGKSSVARRLVELGAALVDADELARAVVARGQPALAEIRAAFGAGVLTADGQLDRPALGALIFSDPAVRAHLEAITHPRIGALSAERVAAALASAAPLVVVDIPLLFEKRREHDFEGVMVVWCASSTQARRLIERDGLTADQARTRIATQLDLDEKCRRATWVIDNNATATDTARQVDAWWATWVRPAD